MTHLVKKHDTGEYCLSEDDPSSITNESSNEIVLSWENGKRRESIESYFSKVKVEGQIIISTARENSYIEIDMVNIVRNLYNEDRNTITKLFEQNFISKGELRRLIYLNRRAEIKQLKIVRDCFKYHEIVTVGSRNRLLLKKAKK